MTPAEFWARVQPSGQTAEQELIAFWERMRDCPCGGKQAIPVAPMRRRAKAKRRDTDDDALLFLLR